jgi:NAD(P)-dependent dehydrogenase (short-subunit alcohol dehydrogenase family)
VALVTGATGGLGRAIEVRLQLEGWQVVGSGRRSGGLRADLGDPSEALELVKIAVRRHGRLDLLVANHAAMEMAPVEEHEPDDWWRIVDVNLTGSFFLAQAAAPHLRGAAGSIVFVSSEWGVTGWPRATAYAASKAGLIGLVRALARELAPEVRVNALAPGVIDTPQLEVDAGMAGIPVDEMKRWYASAAPLGRIATPGEIAETIAFLASPQASYYTGQVFHPNGGTTMAS